MEKIKSFTEVINEQQYFGKHYKQPAEEYTLAQVARMVLSLTERVKKLEDDDYYRNPSEL